MKRLDRLVFLISFVTFVGSLVALYYFDHLMFLTGGHRLGEVLATTKKVMGEAKRRPDRGFTFYKLEKEAQLTNGEYVFTGTRSNILMDFINRTRLQVNEKSLVRIKKIDGGLEIELQGDEGSISGVMAEGEKIKVAVKDEIVELTGEDLTQFTVSAKQGLNTEILAYKKKLKIKHNGEEVTIRDEMVALKDKKIVKPENKNKTKMLASAPEDEPVPEGKKADKTDPKKLKPNKPADDEAGVLVDKTLNLKLPFPPSNMRFLHSKGGSILVLPKAKCKNQCDLQVFQGEEIVFDQTYRSGQSPIARLEVKKGYSFDFKWVFVDGDERVRDTFAVRVFNEKEFSEALNSKIPMEVID